MAAFEPPWLDLMSPNPKPGSSASSAPNGDAQPPTVAAFSPSTSGHSPSLTKQRATILVHQKSPLLVATPPQITRALAYSHPFIAPLNKLAGLLSWTTGDPWESFLMVAAFWACTLYGDSIIRWVGPVLGVVGLILGMYARRYSPLSSTSWSGDKAAKTHQRSDSDILHRHKSLDEIVDALKLFTSRCNILLDPFLRLTDFLSTQRTATSATTRPALTTLFIRIVLVTPVWFLLTLPPLYVVTTKRVILATGTVALTWHSRPARVCRIILWRSRLIRRVCATVTGLQFADPDSGSHGKGKHAGTPRRNKTAHEVAASLAAKRGPEAPGIRFTFTLYENQRRWLGIGWTSSMLAYERASWTDEHLNAAPSTERFELPEVEGGHARWRWVADSEWHLESVEDDAIASLKGGNEADDGGWIYYDNKWRDGRRGKDGWGRYTRRRKWCRDAELVEVTPSTEATPSLTPKSNPSKDVAPAAESNLGADHGATASGSVTKNEDTEASSGQVRKRGWLRRSSQPTSDKSTPLSTSSTRSRDDETDDVHTPFRRRENENTWGLSDDAQMGLG